MFICSGNPEIRETLTTLFVPVRNVYWLLEFSLSTRGERERHTIFYYADRSIWPNKHAVHPVGHKLYSPRPASNLNSLRPVSESQLTSFSRIPQIPSPSLPGMTSFTPLSHFLSGGFIMTSVIVTYSAHEREHLHPMCAPARALSWIVLSLTKVNKI